MNRAIPTQRPNHDLGTAGLINIELHIPSRIVIGLAAIYFCVTVLASESVYFAVVQTVDADVGKTLLYFFELFVACLQAYVFTMLAAVFIGMMVHPQH